MANEQQSAVDRFLEGTDNENKSPFEEQVADPFEAPLETKEEVAEDREEKPLPFNKDPKVLRFIEKEIAKRTQREEPTQNEAQTEDEFKDVIDSFATIIGNDTPEKVNALKNLERAFKSSSEQAVRRAEERIEEIAQRENEADREAEEELENAFEAIEENFDVDLSSPRSQKLRSEFVSFVERIAPKDRNGEVVYYPDMNSSWETFSDMKKATSQPSRAKELANRGMSRSSQAVAQPTKKGSWDSVLEDAGLV